MTITPPVDGDLVDPQWAQEITDALNSLVVNMGTGASPISRIAALENRATTLEGLTTRVGTRLRRVANQSINNNSVDTISFDTEDQDTDGFIAVTASTITIPSGKGGLYVITLSGTSSGSAGATRKFVNISIISAALTGVTGNNYRGNGGAGESDVSATAIVPLAAGDTFNCLAFHNTGSAQNWTFTMSCYRVMQ